MYLGEKTHIKAHSRFVDESSEPTLHEYEIELLDIQPASNVDLSARVNDAREAGNDYYNKGKYEKASRLYEYGINLLSSVDESNEDDELELRRYTLISNNAACLVKVNTILMSKIFYF